MLLSHYLLLSPVERGKNRNKNKENRWAIRGRQLTEARGQMSHFSSPAFSRYTLSSLPDTLFRYTLGFQFLANKIISNI
jgi:hypothetical protein